MSVTSCLEMQLSQISLLFVLTSFGDYYVFCFVQDRLILYLACNGSGANNFERITFYSLCAYLHACVTWRRVSFNQFFCSSVVF